MYDSGSSSLDVLVGGGYRPGHVYVLRGPESVGKTLLCNASLVATQNSELLPILFAAEMFDRDFLRASEECAENITVFRENRVGNIIDILTRINHPSLIVVDSLSMIRSDWDNGSMLSDTDSITPATRHLLSHLNHTAVRTNSVVLCTAQVRGRGKTTTANAAVWQGASFHISMYRSVKGIKLTIEQDPYTRPGQWCYIPVDQGKLRPKLELLWLCVSIGVVSTRGSWYYYGDTRLGQGRDNAADGLHAFREDIINSLRGVS